jgi:hypothetical protein
MQTVEQCLLMYRYTLRQGLGRAGVGTNPGTTDEQVLEEVLKQMKVPVQIIKDLPGLAESPAATPTTQREDPLDALKAHVTAAKEYGYSWMSPADVINLIEYAKEGRLGELKIGF